MRLRAPYVVAGVVCAGLVAWLAIGRGPAHPDSTAGVPAGDGAKRPHVVLLSIDTLRADHLTPYGYTKRNTSPHLAQLAKGGVLFEQAIAVHTNTAPAHTSMLTGQYPLTHGLFANGMSLRKGTPTLATLLRAQGYTTAAFVSGWTLTRRTGLHRGFAAYDDHMEGGGRRRAMSTWRTAKAWLADALQGERPAFLFLHFFDPHFPYRPPGRYLKKLAPGVPARGAKHHKVPGLAERSGVSQAEQEHYVARYDAEIAYADDMVGRLVAFLEGVGAWDRTVLLMTSDHGETLWERPWVLDHGGRAYDEQLHVPFILRLPSGAHGGRRVAEQVSQVDYLPTILDLLDLPRPGRVDGRSLVPLLQGEGGTGARALLSHGRVEPKRVPEIDAKLRRRALMTAVREPPFKMIRYPARDGGEFTQLFDLGQDPGETTNVAAQHAGRVRSLAAHADTDRADKAREPSFSDEVKKQLRALGYME